ncbi:MAG: tetratricopeptide repeat protein [Pyrinomonadaceae bacterium]
MKKDNIMFAVLGLLVGTIIGFMFANSVNKTAIITASSSALPTIASNGANPALPPDHPPIGTSGGSAAGDPSSGAGMPQVTAAIEKAKAAPQDFEAQMTAADLYYQIQRFDDAARFYEAANKLKPADVEPVIKLGNALFDAEKYAEAEKWYTSALQKDPKNIDVRTDLGLTYFLREPRDVDRAIAEYQKSLAINANHEITLQNLVLAYREKGDTAQLAEATERLKKVNPKNPALQSSTGT